MHVVTITVADITNDTRVKRQAIALSRAGYDTTVLSRSASGRPEVLPLGDAVVLAVPLPDDVVGFVREVRARRRAWRPLPAAVRDERSRALAGRRRRAREQADAVRAEGGSRPARALWRLTYAASTRGTEAAQWVDQRMARGWEAFDERFWGSTVGASWRRSLDGLVDDLELTMGPLLDDLAPDAIHAHDMHVLGVAVHAARRARASGREVKVVYDAHEYVAGLAVAGSFTPRSIAGWADLEARYAPLADRVIAVSPGSADAIQHRLALPRRPDVVLNVPVVDPEPTTQSLRGACGLPADVPLAVYSGGIREVRGIDTAIDAVGRLPGVHLAVVCVPSSRSRQVDRLAQRARGAGLAERVHFVDPVGPGHVVPYLASADVGLIPMQGGWLNHELTLPNKLFEYAVAGLPVVVSDLRSLGGVVREHGLGETFAPGDAGSLAAALAAVLADPERYRRAVRHPTVQEMSSWRTQEAVLQGVYADLLGAPPRDPGREDVVTLAERPRRRRRPAPGTAPHVVLGPWNNHGQARALGAALARLAGATVESMMVVRGRGDPRVDVVVPRPAYLHDVVWQSRRLRHVLARASHALVEDGLPLAGPGQGQDGVAQAALLAEAGTRVAFWVTAGVSGPVAERLERWRETLEHVVLVPDAALVADVPGAVWVPRVVADVVDPAQGWDGERPPLVAGVRPGAALEAALAELEAAGRLTYRRDAAGEADVLVDDPGAPGPTFTALRALARGAVVLGKAGPSPAGAPAPPVLPLGGDCAGSVEEVLSDPGRALDAARRGPQYVAEVHDGRRSVAALAGFLGGGEPDGHPGASTLDWAAASPERPSSGGRAPSDGGDE